MANDTWAQRAQKIPLHVQHCINGSLIDCLIEKKARKKDEKNGEKKITKHAPRNGQPHYEFASGNGQDVDAAVSSARDAFNDSRWRGQSIHQRKAVLDRFYNLIDTHKDELALLDCLDVGKPISNALNDDVALTLALLKNTIESADKLVSPSARDGSDFAYQLRKPVGVVASIIGWNYPLLMAVMKIGPALLMGNSLVLKPSEFSPLSASRLAALALEAGVPAGVLNVVQGSGAIVGAALAQHPDVDLLSFTGSSATGKNLMVAAGQSNMKRLLLECGGKSPYLVFDDCPADLEMMAADIVATAFRNQGEFCSAGTRLLIQASIKERLLPKIIEHTAKLKPQDPLDPEASFGALIHEAHLEKVLGYIDSGLQEGAQLIHGGKRIHVDTGTADTESNNKGYYLEPTIFDQVKPHYTIAQQEIFGPVLSILTFEEEEEAIAIANNSCYGLVAYAATENLSRAQRLAHSLNVGYLAIVGSSTLAEGGVMAIGSEPHKQSGMGSETGFDVFEAYTVKTAVHIYA